MNKNFFELLSASCDWQCVDLDRVDRDREYNTRGPTTELERKCNHPVLSRDTIKALVDALGAPGEADLKALWPREDIHKPSRKFVAQRLSLMIGAIPHAAPHSPEVFAHMLLTYVMAEHPSAMVVESTCRELEMTMKFVPAPCEVLEVLRKHKKKWERRLKVDEVIRNGRVKELNDKVLANLECREQGILPSWRTSRSKIEFGTPEYYEHEEACARGSGRSLATRMLYNDPLKDWSEIDRRIANGQISIDEEPKQLGYDERDVEEPKYEDDDEDE